MTAQLITSVTHCFRNGYWLRTGQHPIHRDLVTPSPLRPGAPFAAGMRLSGLIAVVMSLVLVGPLALAAPREAFHNRPAEQVVLAHSNSQPAMLPAMAPAESFPQLQGVHSLTDGNNTCRIDRLNGTLYITADVPPMTVLTLSPGSAGRILAPVAGLGEQSSLMYHSDHGSPLILNQRGVFAGRQQILGIDAAAIAATPSAPRQSPAESGWDCTHRGQALAQFTKGGWSLLCFDSGAAELTCPPGGSFELPADTRIRDTDEFLIARAIQNNDQLDNIHHTLLLAHSMAFVPQGASHWACREGRLYNTSDQPAKAWLIPAEDDDQWFKAAAAASAPMIGSFTDNAWRFHTSTHQACYLAETQKDHLSRNEQQRLADSQPETILASRYDKAPSFHHGAWLWFTAEGDSTGVWYFLPPDQDSRPILESFDLNDTDLSQQPLVPLATHDGPATLLLPPCPSRTGTAYPGPGTDLAEATFSKPLRSNKTIHDLSGQGIFFQGDLRRGGSLFSTRIGSGRMLDLDADGDGDLYTSALNSGAVAVIHGGWINFDIRDNKPGAFLLHAPKPGTFKTLSSGGYVEHTAPYTWMFTKSLRPGIHYKGAFRGFEEQISYRIQKDDQELIEGPALMYLKTTIDQIDRLSMGGFGGDNDLFAHWNIELNPEEARLDQPASYRICQYQDPYGNEVAFTSCVAPDDWDGKMMPLTMHGDRELDFLPTTPWYTVSHGELFDLEGVSATFAVEGTYLRAAEGMYTGHCHSGFRFEYGDRQAMPFQLYYSELMGALHLRGACHGSLGFTAEQARYFMFSIPEYLYHREAVDMPVFYKGGRYTNALEGTRVEGPLYLGYIDTDHDGYIDTYLYDADNNGIIDRALFHNDRTDTLAMQQEGITTAWPWEEQRTVVDYLPGQYNTIESLYLDGLLTPPLVVRTELSDGGIPVEWTIDTDHRIVHPIPAMMEKRPDFYAIAGPEWQAVVGLDRYHNQAARLGWEDFSEHGFSGLALQTAALGFQPSTIDSPLSESTLAGLDVLVLPEPTRPLSSPELSHLLQWVQQGGVLLLVPTDDTDSVRTAMNGISQQLGLQLADDRIEARSSINRYWLENEHSPNPNTGMKDTRYPSPAQRIDHFSSPIEGLFERTEFLTCVGYPLELDERRWQPLLSYQGRPVIAETALGNGTIMVSGINFFANRYINHVQHVQPKAWNDHVMRRLVAHVAETARSPRFDTVNAGEGESRVVLSGHGGTVKWPRSYTPRTITVNGQAATVERNGLFDCLQLPAGRSEIIIKEQ